MGLDIHVNATVHDVGMCLNGLNCPLQAIEAWRILAGLTPEQKICTQPGSYVGLHYVRQEYAKLKRWDYDFRHRRGGKPDPRAFVSHLIHHSDCDGYYLPKRFDLPGWLGGISVGSSYKLLEELMELLSVKDKWEQGFQRGWDALFLPAVASVVCSEVIVFG